MTSYTAGDLLYYASGTTLTKLAIGASTTIMTSSGSAPQWSAASSITVGTATNLAGGVAGSVPYQSGAGATTFLSIGAANTVLTSSGSAPQWSTALTLSGNVTAAAFIPSSSTIPTNGMYYPTTNVLSWATNSALRMTLDTVGNLSTGTSTNNVFDQVAGARALLIQKSDTSTTVGGSLASITIANADTTTSNTAQLNFAAITGASANQYSAAVISCIFGARTNTQYPTGSLAFLTSTSLNSAPSEKARIWASGGVSIGNTTDPGAGNLRVTGSVLVNAVAGVGYTTGAGGTVTQGAGSGKATTMTLDKVCGKVTLNNANLNAGASVGFLLNNNTVTIDDVVTISFDASLASVDTNYTLTNSVGSGQVYFTLKNVSGGNLAQAVKFNFAVIKAATS